MPDDASKTLAAAGAPDANGQAAQSPTAATFQSDLDANSVRIGSIVIAKVLASAQFKIGRAHV